MVLNYTLIYGNFGAPKLWVQGAAIATVIARLVECISILAVVYISKGPAAAKIKELVTFDKEFIKKYFVTVSPVIANEFMWGLGVTMYSLVYGRMGDEAVAAITITQNVEQVCVVIFQGLSSATAVILGNELGANKIKEAEIHSKSFFILQFILTIVMGIVLGLPIYYVYAMITIEEVYKFILVLRRYKQKKWLRNIIDA